MPTPPNKSIAKAVRVLEIVCAGCGHLSIRDIALRAGYSLATTHRVLRTLKQVGALQPMPGGCFALGPRIVELHARIAADLCRTREIVGRCLETLLEEPGISARLSLFVDGRLVIVDGRDSGVHQRFRSRIGGAYDAYCTAPGKTLLSLLPGERLDRYLRSASLRPLTRNTIVEPGRLRRELHAIRAVGYALDDQEYLDGVRCVSVPVPATEQNEVAALSIATESIAPRELMGVILPRLAARANLLAGELNHSPRGVGALLPVVVR